MWPVFDDFDLGAGAHKKITAAMWADEGEGGGVERGNGIGIKSDAANRWRCGGGGRSFSWGGREGGGG